MTVTRLPMIAALMDPVATVTAATGFCAASVAGARIPLSAFDCRRPYGSVRPRFARPYRALPRSAAPGIDRQAAIAAFNSP
jgi:hypothetical protein